MTNQLPKYGQAVVRLSVEEPIPIFDPMLEMARGSFQGISVVNKFGRSTNVDNGIDTDIWDRANAADDQDTWTAPTEARVHQIVSSSASDDGDPLGVGARTIRIFGLTAWDKVEVSEDILMNGVVNVPTVNSYVIIHRMQVLTKGATSVNVGAITATADVDGTVTAQINVGLGQTEMAIYGVPTPQIGYMPNYFASVIKAAAALTIEMTLLVNPEPHSELINFITKNAFGIASDGASYIEHPFKPYFEIPGPAIIKIQGNSSANNTDVFAGFDIILVDN